MLMQFTVSKPDRVDRILRRCQFIGSEWMSRSSWEVLFSEKKIRSHKKGALKPGDFLELGDTICIDLPFSHSGILPSEEVPELIYRSPQGDWGVFFKKSMLNSVSLRPWLKDSLASEVAGFLEKNAEMNAREFSILAEPPILEGGLVQRLDYETSGLLSVAFTKQSKHLLQKMFREKKVQKTYMAIVVGEVFENWEGSLFLCSEKIGDRVVVCKDRRKNSDIEFSFSLKCCSRESGHSLVFIEVVDGFRHVVRASMGALGYALYADAVYGQKIEGESFYLHAYHLMSEEISLNIKAFPPQSFLSGLKKFGLEYKA